MLNGKFNDKWLEMWYDKLVRRCETEKNMDVLYEYLQNNYNDSAQKNQAVRKNARGSIIGG